MSGKVLILTDGKAGHENQSRAFARALGMDFDIVEVHFKSKLAKAKSYLLDRLGTVSLGLLDFEGLKPSQYRAVIGTAEVVALDNLKPGPHKFRRFVENLSSDGYVGGNRKVDLSSQFARARALMGL